MTDYGELNRANWDDRAPAHAGSPGYAVDRFEADPEFLSHVVRFDVPRLGDIRGLRGLHLQCHIGTDTVSLSRLGARMTGLDFSSASIEQARIVAARAGADVDFVVSDVYDAVAAVGAGGFDLVFTGIGALCWLPDIARWAEVVAGLLRPGGRLFLREGHPVLWALDDERTDGVLALRYPYFEMPEPNAWDESDTYVETDVVIAHSLQYNWSHGLGELVSALLAQGLVITGLEEHRSVPWLALPGQMVHDPADDEWRLIEGPERMPLTYTLQAVKPR